jgi:hypothetical protein
MSQPVMRRIAAILGLIISGLYLLNFDAGIFELIPDNLPIVGNLDEVAFTLLLLWSISVVREKKPGHSSDQPAASP